MKTILSVTLACSIMLSTLSASAQKVFNDPSYSVHNYKHPNKAAYMKKLQDEKPVVYYEEVDEQSDSKTNSGTSSANYKGMSARKSKIKKFRVADAPAFERTSSDGNGNYKQQFAPRNRKSDLN